ncbi:uncharacterized protein LOC142584886 isoform X2 [Dermacentor variabilis]|uniref:uncharacterized protein LOC142558248 isoform X2 n=1 Tax=Dermacentor variabilis TaxID=34621 RepID=UPI003F5CA5D3
MVFELAFTSDTWTQRWSSSFPYALQRVDARVREASSSLLPGAAPASRAAGDLLHRRCRRWETTLKSSELADRSSGPSGKPKVPLEFKDFEPPPDKNCRTILY